MASYYEPMDVDEGELEPDFDKENAFRTNRDNVPKTPTTEKGYEELDVSELNMKLRMSCTPMASPTPRRFTGSCNQKLFPESGDDSLDITVTENPNLTLTLSSGDQNDNSSLQLTNSTIEVDENKNSTVLHHFNDSTFSSNNNATTLHLSNGNNISIPTVSTCTTPIATTPTKEIPNTSTSPIMRGLKSVLSMFRPSQSPITSADSSLAIKDNIDSTQSGNSPNPSIDEQNVILSSNNVLASTPVHENNAKKGEHTLIKGNSPHIPESIVFNEDLMNELQWNDDTTIIFNKSKLPGRKLYTNSSLRESSSSFGSYSRESIPSTELTPSFSDSNKTEELIQDKENSADTTVEYMDISMNDSNLHYNNFDSKAQESVALKESEGIRHGIIDISVGAVNETVIEESALIDCQIKNESRIDPSNNINEGTFVSSDDKDKNEMYADAVDTKVECTKEYSEKVIQSETVLDHFEQDFKRIEISTNLKELSNFEVKDKCDNFNSMENTINNEEIMAKIEKSLDPTYKNITEITIVSELKDNIEVISDIDDKKKCLELEFQHIETDASEDYIELKPHNNTTRQNNDNVKLNIHAIESPLTTESQVSRNIGGNVENPLATKTRLTVSPPPGLNETFISLKSDVVNPQVSIETPDFKTEITKIEDETGDITRNSVETSCQDPISTLEILCYKQIENIIDSDPISLDSLNNLNMGADADIPLLEMPTCHETVEMKNTIVDVENIDQLTEITNPPGVGKIISENDQNLRRKEDEEVVTSENNSPYISLNAPTEDEIMQISGNAEINFDAIENPFVTKSRITMSPPPNNIDDIHNPFVSKVTISPQYQINDTLQKKIQGKSEINSHGNNKLSIAEEVAESQSELNSVLNSPLDDIVVKLELLADHVAETSGKNDKPYLSTIVNGDKQTSEIGNVFKNLSVNEITENKEILKDIHFKISSLNVINDKIENVTNNDTEISTSSHLSDTLNGIDSQEHSSFYESAENSSGRTSEQLLESELEIIEQNKPEETKGLDFECVNPFATKSKIRTSPFTLQESLSEPLTVPVSDHKNPFATNSKIRMSPPLTNETIISNINTEKLPNFDIESPFTSKNKLRSSPPLTQEVGNCSNIELINSDENPFVTKTKIRLSPQLAEDETPSKIEPSNRPFTPKRKVQKSPQKKTPLILTDLPDFDAESPFATKIKIRMSPPLSLEGSDQNFVDVPTPNCENPFATKSKIRKSPPPTTATPLKVDFQPITDENPFATKSKIRLSPPLLQDGFQDNGQELCNNMSKIEHFQKVGLNENNEAYLELNVDKIEFSLPDTDILPNSDINSTLVIGNNEDNKELPTPDTDILSKMNENTVIEVITDKQESPLPDGEIFSNIDANSTTVISNCPEIGSLDNDATLSSGSSNISDDKDITIREVKTEDEDTMEGPDFSELTTDNIENPFETKSKIRVSTPAFEKSVAPKNSPKVIICSDIKQTETLESAQASNSDNEFEQCTDEEFKPGELFINADEFDFLMNQNTAGETKDYGKESLFLKFDPLCAKRISTGIAAALLVNEDKPDEVNVIEELVAQENQRDVTVPDVKTKCIPEILSPNTMATEENLNFAKEENSLSISIRSEKPTMAVIPAVNDQTLTSNISYTPTRPDRRSITFSSPAIAAIDRLISLSGNNSPNQTFSALDRQSQESAEAIMELRDLLAEKEQQVQQLRAESYELHNRLTELQAQMKSVEDDNEDRLKKINDLQAKLAHKTVLNKNMAAAVEEYERAISGMIGENEQEKQKHQQERANLIKERDEQVAHLASMEVSFNDLHTKYERTKQVILAYKANEEIFRKTIEEYKNNVKKLETNYELLKQQATSKLNNSNMELEKIRKAHEAEVLKLTSLVKRKELHATSLEESLAQKVKANEELTAICDELISKVG